MSNISKKSFVSVSKNKEDRREIILWPLCSRCNHSMFLRFKGCLRNWGKGNKIESAVTEYVGKTGISYIFLNNSHRSYQHSLSTPSRALFLCASPFTSSLLPIQVLAAWISCNQHSPCTVLGLFCSWRSIHHLSGSSGSKPLLLLDWGQKKKIKHA